MALLSLPLNVIAAFIFNFVISFHFFNYDLLLYWLFRFPFSGRGGQVGVLEYLEVWNYFSWDFLIGIYADPDVVRRKQRSLLDSILSEGAVIIPCKGLLKACAMSLPVSFNALTM